MKKIGITGQTGFVGQHLYNTLGLTPDTYQRIEFKKDFFEDETDLDKFVSQCDVIVHLAAMNRHESQEFIYNNNIELVERLIASLERNKSKAHVLFSSSTQEDTNNFYGQSKKKGRLLFSNWAHLSGGKFTGMLIPNVFGPFGQPFYNSVIATFCHQVSRDETPIIEIDNQIKLIYVGELVEEIIKAILTEDETYELKITHTAEVKVSEILNLLQSYKKVYQKQGEFPVLNSSFEHKLFNTYRCYMDNAIYFPRKFIQYTDNRGGFIEIARHGITGQVSYSTTKPGIIRGNHFHTRKIERFAVIKGKALIQLRRIGTKEVYEFYLDGEEPAYVDMPIWFTHNIKNIGDDTLYTIFWIDEPYNEKNPDTYFELVSSN
jgi:UDP-2-acetamido-2,6-beta-L-arabino-hexul-4-ose reductase